MRRATWMALLLGIGLAGATVWAQQGTASIFGTVTDPQGAAVAGATVEITNQATGAVFRTRTTDTGYYSAPGLPVGTYAVAVELQGFKRAERSGIRLQVNQNAEVNLRLEIGQLTETVRVVAETPLVDTGSATLGQVIENRRVQELPLNGRSALALTLLTAGVVANSGPLQSGFGDRGIGLSSISINGGPNSMNAQMLDGNNNNLSYIGEVGVPLAVDAVEEFKVQSGTMSAEYGFTAGGVINLVTKSGTNELHGTAYWFVRNDKFDARNTYALSKLPLRYNQYGTSLGGPFVKNRTFGFFNWEQYLLRRSWPNIASVPIASWRQGDFSNWYTASGVLIPVYDPDTTRPNPAGAGQIRDVFPGNRVPASRFDAITPKILAFWPEPNKPPINPYTQAQNFQNIGTSKVDWTQMHVRVDHRFSDRNSLFVRYSTAEHDTFSPPPNAGTNFFTDPTVGQDRRDHQINRNAMLSDTHVFSPTLINNLRVGIIRQFFTFRAVNGGRDWPRKLGLPPVVPPEQFPQINFGFGTIGGQAYGTRASLNWDIQNMLSKITGSHTLKFGVNLRIPQGSNMQGAALSGDFSFSGLTTNPQSPAGTGSSLAQFLLGDVSSAYCDRITGNTFVGNAISWFVQDDWKVTRRLTLNLGLRYDFQKKPVERHDGHISFDPVAKEPITGLPGITIYAGRNGQPRSFRKEDYNDFGPRFGLAWDLFGNSRTVFRAGYGIYYPFIHYRDFFGNTQLFSSTRTSYTAAEPGRAAFKFARGFPYPPLESPGASAGPSALIGQGASWTEDFGATPLNQQWNASLQQQFGQWLVDVTYAGNKGNHFIAAGYNLNQVDPKVRAELGLRLFDQVPNPWAGLIPGGLGGRTTTRERLLMAYPHYTSVSVYNPLLGNFIAHQLQLNVRRNFAHGFMAHLAYTAGKTISDSLNTPVNWNLEQNDIGYQDGLYNRRLSRAVDPLDVSQRAVVSLLYELPFGPGKPWSPQNRALRRLAGGWQLNAIGVMQTGTPLIVSGASNYQATRPNATGSARLPRDQRSPKRWFNTDVFYNPPPFTMGTVGRTLPDARNPATINWDVSAIKNNSVRERFNLQFRAEAFNFTNHVNLGRPATGFSPGPDGKNASASFGTITSARDARVIQFGLKMIF